MSNELVFAQVTFLDIVGGQCIMEGPFKTIPKEGEEFYIYTKDEPLGFLYKVVTVKRYYQHLDHRIQQENYRIYLLNLGYGSKK